MARESKVAKTSIQTRCFSLKEEEHGLRKLRTIRVRLTNGVAGSARYSQHIEPHKLNVLLHRLRHLLHLDAGQDKADT